MSHYGLLNEKNIFYLYFLIIAIVLISGCVQQETQMILSEKDIQILSIDKDIQFDQIKFSTKFNINLPLGYGDPTIEGNAIKCSEMIDGNKNTGVEVSIKPSQTIYTAQQFNQNTFGFPIKKSFDVSVCCKNNYFNVCKSQNVVVYDTEPSVKFDKDNFAWRSYQINMCKGCKTGNATCENIGESIYYECTIPAGDGLPCKAYINGEQVSRRCFSNKMNNFLVLRPDIENTVKICCDFAGKQVCDVATINSAC